ncbi:sulfurtransferase TusA family protein [candidate division KSB1 bacterium]|nr:sulfurtransferase TusA family protein [candidate division KSB1 bacterium]
MKANRTLDCLGLYCPMPIIKTAEMIKEMNVGHVLEIVADDPGIEEDMPSWCKMTGHEYLGQDIDGDEFHVFVKKVK